MMYLIFLLIKIVRCINHSSHFLFIYLFFLFIKMNEILLLLIRFYLLRKINVIHRSYYICSHFLNIIFLKKKIFIVSRIKQHRNEKIYVFRFINLLILKKYFLFLAIIYDNYKSSF